MSKKKKVRDISHEGFIDYVQRIYLKEQLLKDGDVIDTMNDMVLEVLYFALDYSDGKKRKSRKKIIKSAKAAIKEFGLTTVE